MAGEQILVVEDQRAVAGALKMRLRGLGYDVAAICKDGFEAIEKAIELQPDLILMDIRLGEGMDGIECAQRIRAQFDIPVIYISAHVDQRVLERARATRPAGFINKPFTTKDLLTAIDFALHRAGDAPPTLSADAPSRALEAVVTADADGRIGFVSPQAEAILGLHRRQLIGRPLAEVIASRYDLAKSEAAAHVARVLQGGTDIPLEGRATGAGEQATRLPDKLGALLDAGGNVYAVAWKLQITPRASAHATGEARSIDRAYIKALDAVPNGILIVNSDLRVLHLNRCARDILSRNRGLELRNDVIGIQDKLLDHKLRELVDAAAAKGRQGQDQATGAMFVQAPLSREHLEIIVAPVPNGGLADSEARVLIYLFDAASPRQVSHDVLTGLYGLTQSEAKLVQLMSNGLTLDEAADELAISVNTARTHLKHVFHKTGINRQTELIHRIESGPATLLVRFEESTGLPSGTRK